ncbi:MAG: hypothetical protein Q7S56_02470 [Nanoarchaeota archaeon]|nr:hypothetical protein [Nanoarchaeota archaeon]
MENSLERLFSNFNKNKIDFCILRKYQELPKKTIGDVDILINKEDFTEALKIVNKEDFVFYPYTEPHYFFFKHDIELGLITLDITKGKMLSKEKLRNFYIPKDGQDIRIKKGILQKLRTNLRRKLHYLFNGKLICFIGPDGSGKSTYARKVLHELESYPLKKELIYFGTRSNSKIIRVFDLIYKICKVYLNKFLGRITLTDRYIYLTFRKRPFLNNLIRILVPKPNKIYLLEAKPETIRKRKKELSVEEIKELYEHYSKINRVIKVNNEDKLDKNINGIVNEILLLYNKE